MDGTAMSSLISKEEAAEIMQKDHVIAQYSLSEIMRQDCMLCTYHDKCHVEKIRPHLPFECGKRRTKVHYSDGKA